MPWELYATILFMKYLYESPTYESWAPVIGRILFSIPFFVGALFKVMWFSMEVAQTTAAGVPLPTIAVGAAFVLELATALMLLLGWRTRLAAAVLAAYVLLLALIFYH